MADQVFAVDTDSEFPVTFQDIDAELLAREDAIQREGRAALINGSAWGEFLRKVLSPAGVQPTMRVLRASQA